jgi:hypothetical protein
MFKMTSQGASYQFPTCQFLQCDHVSTKHDHTMIPQSTCSLNSSKINKDSVFVQIRPYQEPCEPLEHGLSFQVFGV